MAEFSSFPLRRPSCLSPLWKAGQHAAEGFVKSIARREPNALDGEPRTEATGNVFTRSLVQRRWKASRNRHIDKSNGAAAHG